MVFWFKPKKPGLFGFFIKTMVFPNPEFDHIFKTIRNFSILFFFVKEHQKTHKNDAIILQEHNISKKKYAFMLKKSKISKFSIQFLCMSLNCSDLQL